MNDGGQHVTVRKPWVQISNIVSGAGRRRLAVFELLLCLILSAAPLALPDYLMVFVTRILILSLLAISFDLVWGYAGILSFGQALFFGIGGYAAALLARDHEVRSVLVLLPIATFAGFAVAILMSFVVVFGRGVTQIFASLSTLTASYAAYRFAYSWYYLGGQNGIPSLPYLKIGATELGDGPASYYFALAVVLIVYLVSRAVVRSQFGLALSGIREAEQRVAFLGYRVSRLKAAVFIFAGAIAGLSGGLSAFHEGFIGPGALGIVLSSQVVFYCLIGGSGTLLGAVIGVILTETLSYALSDRFPDVWPIALGVALLLAVMFRPNGVISVFISPRERLGNFGRATAQGRDELA
ncbi:branched-chain amino acid ABC transporter permease [Pararobbsia alpina]|uniref:High-affinity branched-chain amino acid transport system permease protein LivH n=1 Tax=Pararobbsia alpina TaxID=621374 RepID=A0A6S7BXM8_9BURK|nr:branched-chain amino acid ABC transporter permease [Pararobbsia alpina]CAB3797027.1 hypothetical protein LMG28138_04174 [Pararobbsia alpina]